MNWTLLVTKNQHLRKRVRLIRPPPTDSPCIFQDLASAVRHAPKIDQEITTWQLQVSTKCWILEAHISNSINIITS